MLRRSEPLRIVLLALGSAVLYGVLHDQVTARLCPEYFTVHHDDLGLPALFHSDSPTILGLAWGVVATWWVGLPFGILLAACARAGRWPKLTAAELQWPILAVLAAAGASALVGGGLLIDYVDVVPSPERPRAYFVALLAHRTSYLVGLYGGVVLCAVTLLRRWLRGLPR